MNASTFFVLLLGSAAGGYLINCLWRKIVATSMNDFVTEVEETETVIASAITLITGMSARIKDLVAAGAGLDAFAALADRLDSATDKLAEAVAAVSPDAIEPPPVVNQGDALPADAPAVAVDFEPIPYASADKAVVEEGVITADTLAPAAKAKKA